MTHLKYYTVSAYVRGNMDHDLLQHYCSMNVVVPGSQQELLLGILVAEHCRHSFVVAPATMYVYHIIAHTSHTYI